MDGVEVAERRRPSSCPSSFNFLAVKLRSWASDAVQMSSVGRQAFSETTPGSLKEIDSVDPRPLQSTSLIGGGSDGAVETTHHVDDDEVPVDLTTISDRRYTATPTKRAFPSSHGVPPPPQRASPGSPGPGSWPPRLPVREAASTPVPETERDDIYRRYLDDLRQLDALIRRRTYERNVLSWRRDQTKRSLDRLIHPVTVCLWPRRVAKAAIYVNINYNPQRSSCFLRFRRRSKHEEYRGVFICVSPRAYL